MRDSGHLTFLEKVNKIKVIQSPLFLKQKKKLFKKQINILDKEIRKINKNPQIGNEKKGTFRGIGIHKFHIEKELFLLAYEIKNNSLNLIMIGSHENYYRDLSRHQRKD
jgi:mRNA-degrading endonuclease RelE of RelBE toxin-antitoxin system